MKRRVFCGSAFAYGLNYPRLSALKAKHGPTNLFRMNANIKPQA